MQLVWLTELLSIPCILISQIVKEVVTVNDDTDDGNTVANKTTNDRFAGTSSNDSDSDDGETPVT